MNSSTGEKKPTQGGRCWWQCPVACLHGHLLRRVCIAVIVDGLPPISRVCLRPGVCQVARVPGPGADHHNCGLAQHPAQRTGDRVACNQSACVMALARRPRRYRIAAPVGDSLLFLGSRIPWASSVWFWSCPAFSFCQQVRAGRFQQCAPGVSGCLLRSRGAPRRSA